MSNYSFPDRFLHRLALQSASVAELSFDLDQRALSRDPKEIVDERHVFVSGLARAGTTVLMRNFHATGVYRSLTYRDMPFVLAPNLWRKLVKSSKREIARSERAHGDHVEVDADSPESLDEVFWRIFAGDEYIGKRTLKPHAPDAETTWKYVSYVNAILAAQDTSTRRYLCKNNNNILRLKTLRQAFPNALILVPFRDPVAHASSLLRQHRNFIRIQGGDRFARSYMGWLVHHEFGRDHRPFRFGGPQSNTQPSADPDDLAYWLELWCATYQWLERSAPGDAIFVCYEDLCADEGVWRHLANLADVSDRIDEGRAFRSGNRATEGGRDSDLTERADEIYARLVGRARAALQ